MAGAAGSGFGDGIDRSSSSELDLVDYELPHLGRRLDAALGFLRKYFVDDVAAARKDPMCQGQYGSIVASQKRALRYEELKRYSIVFAMLEDAKSLKNLADRMQNQEANAGTLQLDGTMTFSNGASLLEECLAQADRLRDATVVFYQYKEVATIFRSTAITNERNGKPEAAVLAYKCLEFAYMRIVSLLSTISKKGLAPERNLEPRQELRQLLSIGDHARCAIDAGQRWQQILECTALHQQISQECMSSIKKVLECDHHDIEHFIHLVNLALREIGT